MLMAVCLAGSAILRALQGGQRLTRSVLDASRRPACEFGFGRRTWGEPATSAPALALARTLAQSRFFSARRSRSVSSSIGMYAPLYNHSLLYAPCRWVPAALFRSASWRAANARQRQQPPLGHAPNPTTDAGARTLNNRANRTSRATWRARSAGHRDISKIKRRNGFGPLSHSETLLVPLEVPVLHCVRQ